MWGLWNKNYTYISEEQQLVIYTLLICHDCSYYYYTAFDVNTGYFSSYCIQQEAN